MVALFHYPTTIVRSNAKDDHVTIQKSSPKTGPEVRITKTDRRNN